MKKNQKGFGILEVLIIIIVLLLLFGVGEYVYSRYKHSHVSYQEVSSRPEANLLYPGSTVIRKVGSGQEPSFAGNKSPAFAGAVAATTATAQQVNDFYSKWMTAHGWTPYSIGLVGPEISAQGYQRGARERFTLGIDDPKLLAGTISSSIPRDKTIYEFRYFLPPPQ